jgi:hypothetical protein
MTQRRRCSGPQRYSQSQMADGEHESQPTQPKGIDPKTGKPYEPIEIPVPKEREIEDLLSRAVRNAGHDASESDE